MNLDGIDPEITKLRDQHDWYILSLVNPDGYHFTWSQVSILLLYIDRNTILLNMVTGKHYTTKLGHWLTIYYDTWSLVTILLLYMVQVNTIPLYMVTGKRTTSKHR